MYRYFSGSQQAHFILSLPLTRHFTNTYSETQYSGIFHFLITVSVYAYTLFLFSNQATIPNPNQRNYKDISNPLCGPDTTNYLEKSIFSLAHSTLSFASSIPLRPKLAGASFSTITHSILLLSFAALTILCKLKVPFPQPHISPV